MQQRKCMIIVAIFCALFLLCGCSNKSEDKKTQATPKQEAPVQNQTGVAGTNQRDKAVAFHKAFLEKFYHIGGVRNMDFYKRRVEFAETTYTEANKLLSETQDPQAREFLTKFIDLLQQYADGGHKVISMGEQIEKIDQDLKELQDNPQAMGDSSIRYAREKALGESRSFSDMQQGLAKGALEKLERELSELQ